MLLGAIVVVALASAATPLDGRYFLEGAPSQCRRPVGHLDSALMLTRGRLDAYEELCTWGALHPIGRRAWIAQGRCFSEGRKSPGTFQFAFRHGALELGTPDGATRVLRRCEDRPHPPSAGPRS